MPHHAHIHSDQRESSFFVNGMKKECPQTRHKSIAEIIGKKEALYKQTTTKQPNKQNSWTLQRPLTKYPIKGY